MALRKHGDDLLDAPMLDNLFTGTIEINNLRGWTEDGQVSLRQDVPGPLTLRSMLAEISV